MLVVSSFSYPVPSCDNANQNARTKTGCRICARSYPRSTLNLTILPLSGLVPLVLLYERPPRG